MIETETVVQIVKGNESASTAAVGDVKTSTRAILQDVEIVSESVSVRGKGTSLGILGRRGEAREVAKGSASGTETAGDAANEIVNAKEMHGHQGEVQLQLLVLPANCLQEEAIRLDSETTERLHQR